MLTLINIAVVLAVQPKEESRYKEYWEIVTIAGSEKFGVERGIYASTNMTKFTYCSFTDTLICTQHHKREEIQRKKNKKIIHCRNQSIYHTAYACTQSFTYI